MDYKETIEAMRSTDVKVVFSHSIDAADAIETLPAERDAAVEELRGICWCCANGKPMRTNAWPHNKITTCEHLAERGILGHAGRRKECPYWQWRGPQKGDGA